MVRKTEQRSFDVTLVREKIKVQSVKSKLLDGGYGYLRVTQFQEETAPDVVKHLDRLAKVDKDAKFHKNCSFKGNVTANGRYVAKGDLRSVNQGKLG